MSDLHSRRSAPRVPAPHARIDWLLVAFWLGAIIGGATSVGALVWWL